MFKKALNPTDYEMTLSEVSEALFESEVNEAKATGQPLPKKKFTTEYIRQIEASALKKIRQNIGLI